MQSRQTEHLDCSVIIPTYNRPEALAACISALEKQNYSGRWEIIVVNDGGKLSDTQLAIKGSNSVRFIDQQNKGPAAARNNGVKHSKGQFIAFTDDDCEPDSHWLEQLMKNARPGYMIGGKTQNKFIHNRFSETSQQLVSFLYKEWEGSPWYFFTSNNFMVHRQTFLDIGGFDESFPTSAGEDREFCARWIQRGYQMEYVSTAIVNHAHDLKFQSFWKMHFKYGGAAFLFGKKIRESGVHVLKPRISFYVRLFSFVLRHNRSDFKRSISISFLIFVSQLATLFGLVKEKLKH